MDIKTLYTLIAVADHGSFNEAAKVLGLSLSSISLQMKGLEDEGDLILFDRSKRPPPLTDEGRDFVERSRRLIGEWERLSATLVRPNDRGLLKIGAVHTVVSGLLPAALAHLRTQAPDLRIRLTTGLTHELEAALIGGRIDIAVVTEPNSVPAGLEFTLFREEPLVVIAHRDATGSDENEDFRSVLEHNPYVRFNRQAHVSGLIETDLARQGIAITSEMEIDTLEGVISMVEAGLGVSIVPARTGTAFPRDLRSFPFGDPPVTRRLGVLAPLKNARRRFFPHLLEALQAASQTDRDTPARKIRG